MKNNFLNSSLNSVDSEINNLISEELQRQQNTIELIASENIVSKSVMEAQGSILTNKYAEGYPNKRYYGGCEVVDKIETLAIERVKKLFNCGFANVQPHSGSQANMAVYLALVNIGDTILGMDLNAGGHLTHGSSVSFSSKLYNAKFYNVLPSTMEIDYDNLRAIAHETKPKLIIAGGSSYSKFIDFKKFKEIASEVGAYLMVDMAHFAGLVASGLYDNPLNYADVVTSTTHKTLRGPRGGIILSNNEEIMKKINFAVFPHSQGGPLEHVIAAKAVAFKEAMSTDFKDYSKQIIKNAKHMCNFFIQQGLDVVSGVTDTHLFMLNVHKIGLYGKLVENILDTVNITLNKNSVPYDTLSPNKASGIRIGTPAITTRGFKEQESEYVASLIIDVLNNINKETGILPDNIKNKTKENVLKITSEFPIY